MLIAVAENSALQLQRLIIVERMVHRLPLPILPQDLLESTGRGDLDLPHADPLHHYPRIHRVKCLAGWLRNHPALLIVDEVWEGRTLTKYPNTAPNTSRYHHELQPE